MNKLKFHARRPIWLGDRVHLHVLTHTQSGKSAIATNMTFDELSPNESVSSCPVMDMSFDEAQSLMNELWECGVRPAGAAGSMGQLTAVNAHLQDMRKIAFRSLGEKATDWSAA